MPTAPSYSDNPSVFAAFQEAQRRFSFRMAHHPEVIRAWLASKPPRAAARADRGSPSLNWRSARLNSARRRQLLTLLDGCGGESGREALVAWLLSAIPVSSYLELAGLPVPSLGALDPEAALAIAAVSSLRNRLFTANYGLAKAAAIRRLFGEFEDALSAASSGLLDAIDRYIPGERAARFGYFAMYWIRYRMNRQAQKQAGVVTIPINQRRRGRDGAPAPFGAAVVVPLQGFARDGELLPGLDRVLCDPCGAPGDDASGEELDLRVRTWLAHRLPAATRVMLAYRHGIGSLTEAALAYLEQRAAACDRGA